MLKHSLKASAILCSIEKANSKRANKKNNKCLIIFNMSFMTYIFWFPPCLYFSSIPCPRNPAEVILRRPFFFNTLPNRIECKASSICRLKYSLKQTAISFPMLRAYLKLDQIPIPVIAKPIRKLISGCVIMKYSHDNHANKGIQ